MRVAISVQICQNHKGFIFIQFIGFSIIYNKFKRMKRMSIQILIILFAT